MCFFTGQRSPQVLFVVYNNCPGQQDTQIEHAWDVMKREFTLSAEPATTIVELRQRVQYAWGNLYHRMTFGTFMTVCMREYTPALPLDGEGVTLLTDVTVWATLL